MEKDFLKVELKRMPCIEGLSEDALVAFVNALKVSVEKDEFTGFVLSTKGTEVEFTFGGDGNFLGAYAKVNNQNVPLIHGVNSKRLYLFKGPPTSQNPGAGWTLEVDLTRTYLNQPALESSWEVFFASRSNVIN